MRKLSLVFAFALVSTTIFAQEGMDTAAADAQAAVQEVAVQEVVAVQEKEEVAVSELPEAVTKTLTEEFADYSADKAFKATENEKEVYYINLLKENEALTVVIDADGNVVAKQ